MLTKMETSAMPRITKKVNDADASLRGAFAAGDIVDFTVEVPRRLGASAVVLRICRDGEEDRDYPLSFFGTDCGTDSYTLTLNTADLCGEAGEGLFYYEFLFLRGYDTLFTSTRNQVDFSLEKQSGERFVLLVYEAGYHVPKWFGGRVMYQIFVDRFRKGKGPVGTRSDVIINEDWENGIPQYAKVNGGQLANNMFFGGNLWGVAEKLDCLKDLGVGVLYLCPIFRAYSNHKYDTGDYLEIDEMFGGEAAFTHLIEEAKKRDIRIILDGVFNHTGDNSRYFDRYGEYGKEGAYTDPDSKYRNWYRFKKYPEEYETWWGIKVLPKLNSADDSCREFLAGKGGVGEKYIQMGIDGWRLDVADELTDAFLDEFRQTVKAASGEEAMIIGEVWENAAVKIAYDKRRRYFRGRQLDSVMNYPVRNGILALLLDGDASFLGDTLKEIYATYPKEVCNSLMNLLGTHDTERILTVLGEGNERSGDETNDTLAKKRLDGRKYRRGVALLKIAAAIQFTVYGVPSIFYGDEAGLEGYHDPFCRRPYPWGRENRELVEYYRILGRIRREHSVFADGDFAVQIAEGTQIAYVRKNDRETITVVVNAGDEVWEYPVSHTCTDLLTGRPYFGEILPYSVLILHQRRV